jgi:hypothetical protein
MDLGPLFSGIEAAAFLTERALPGPIMEFAAFLSEADPVDFEALHALNEAVRMKGERYCLRCRLLKDGECKCPAWKLNIKMRE